MPLGTESREKLILFTRYPEPGRVKTRLIPALGPQGAADLQRRMTEHTLAQILMLQRGRPVNIEIRFSGGNPDRMRKWLSASFVFRPQGPGNLGDRLRRSFAGAFASGMRRVVVIGADCPALNTSFLARAFSVLGNKDAVLGPAHDGGYYLIGLKSQNPQLFDHIAWGGDKVLSGTLANMRKTGLSWSLLAPLADVDRPEDLVSVPRPPAVLKP